MTDHACYAPQLLLAMTLQEKTLNALGNLSVTSDSRLLVAVSGGPDSLALAHVLQSLRGTGSFESLAAAHVNHGLRPASEQEESAVRRYCMEWDVPCNVKRVDTERIAAKKKTGIEETARTIRYEFFEELAEAQKFDFVLTAHTANDQAETVILNMVRGAGVRGLAGIPPKRKLGDGFVLRPWLDITKEEILEYLREHDLAAANDMSNEELTYQRNRVRHKVLPVLAEVWPDRSPVKSLAALAGRMRELSNFLDSLAEEKLALLELDNGLSLEGLKNLHGFPLHALLEAWLHKSFGHYGLTSDESERIEAWLASDARVMELRRGIRLRKVRKALRLEIQ